MFAICLLNATIIDVKLTWQSGQTERMMYEMYVVQLCFFAQEYGTSYSYPFVPVEDEVVRIGTKPLLHDRPINIMKKPLRPALWEIPWLVGVTSHEGLPQSLRKS